MDHNFKYNCLRSCHTHAHWGLFPRHLFASSSPLPFLGKIGCRVKGITVKTLCGYIYRLCCYFLFLYINDNVVVLSCCCVRLARRVLCWTPHHATQHTRVITSSQFSWLSILGVILKLEIQTPITFICVIWFFFFGRWQMSARLLTCLVALLPCLFVACSRFIHHCRKLLWDFAFVSIVRTEGK